MPLTTTEKIHRHFFCIPLGQMVASRDLLIHGKRSRIDKAVYVLIKQKVIWRVANGVFIRAGGRWPTVEEVAKFKAEAFGRQLRKHGRDTAAALMITKDRNKKTTYYIDAGSSSFFCYKHGRIYFRSVSKKRAFLEDSAVGQAVRAFWSLGKKNFNRQDLRRRGLPWNGSRDQFTTVVYNKKWMPAWFGDSFQISGYIGPAPLRFNLQLTN